MKRVLLVLTGIILLSVSAEAQKYSPAGDRIMTTWGEELSPDKVWQEYPRPQLERESWINLNGLWDFALLPKNAAIPGEFQGKILVPFCIESALSGVGKGMLPDERLWYRRTFNLPEAWGSERIILNFEAVDWSSSVWVNGAFVGSHKGGYDRFSFDITEYLHDGDQELVVMVDDPSNLGSQARGKQLLSPQGIWYTPVSGIWQTVWLEAVNREAAIGEVKITPNIDKEMVELVPLLIKPRDKGYELAISIYSGKELVVETTVPADQKAEIRIDQPELWSPTNPFLYDLKLVLYNTEGQILDRVDSYFGMRKISVAPNNGAMVLHLNNKALFHYGTLDQGWWPDGLYTPPSDEAMAYDIEITKAMGFNMIRKHVKVEPDRWYYHCDRLGILVWQDMPSGQVMLPGKERSKHIQQVSSHGDDLFMTSSSASQFEWELRRMIDMHYNAPSIVMWVPFNEGWGQYATCRINNMIKVYDPSRLVNAVSGWALRPCGDVYDIHSYHTEVHTPPLSLDMASVLGEYGGIGYPVKGHQWDTAMRNWGYQTYHSEKELLENYKSKFDQIVEMKKSRGLSAAVYTQTTDVEGEVNGLMTYDRKVVKIPAETLKGLHSVLYKD